MIFGTGASWRFTFEQLRQLSDAELAAVVYAVPVPVDENFTLRRKDFTTLVPYFITELKRTGVTNAGRMPLFMPTQEMELQWINRDMSDEEISEIVSYELPSDQLEYWPVYTIRSPKTRPDEKSKVDPWE